MTNINFQENVQFAKMDFGGSVLQSWISEYQTCVGNIKKCACVQG